MICGHAEFLEDELDSDQLRDAETIVRWSNDIVNIVQRVRTVFEMFIGDSTLELEPVELRSELQTELKCIETTYPEVTVDASIPDDVWVLANELLGEVLGNLITNAIDHNEADGLHISFTVDDEFTTVCIADNGQCVADNRKEAISRRDEKGT